MCVLAVGVCVYTCVHVYKCVCMYEFMCMYIMYVFVCVCAAVCCHCYLSTGADIIISYYTPRLLEWMNE